MRRRCQQGFGQDALDRCVGALARRTAGAIGDRDEIRLQAAQAGRSLATTIAPSREFSAGRIRTTRECCAAHRPGRSGLGVSRSSRYLARWRGEQNARIAREPERHRDLALRSRRQSLLAHGFEARSFEPLRHRLRQQSRGDDARAPRAGIRDRAARNRPPASARRAAARAAASRIARAPSSRKCSTWWMMTASKVSRGSAKS